MRHNPVYLVFEYKEDSVNFRTQIHQIPLSIRQMVNVYITIHSVTGARPKFGIVRFWEQTQKQKREFSWAKKNLKTSEGLLRNDRPIFLRIELLPDFHYAHPLVEIKLEAEKGVLEYENNGNGPTYDGMVPIMGYGMSDMATWHCSVGCRLKRCICVVGKFNFKTYTKGKLQVSINDQFIAWADGAVIEDLQLRSRDYRCPNELPSSSSSDSASPPLNPKKRKLEDGPCSVDAVTESISHLRVAEGSMFLSRGVGVPYLPLHQILTTNEIGLQQIRHFFEECAWDITKREFYNEQLQQLIDANSNPLTKQLITILQTLVYNGCRVRTWQDEQPDWEGFTDPLDS